MNIEEGYSFTVTDENGNETICDTLSVVNIEGENPIVIYTDYSLDNIGNFSLFASKVISDGDYIKLERINDDSILPEVRVEMDKILNNIQPTDSN